MKAHYSPVRTPLPEKEADPVTGVFWVYSLQGTSWTEQLTLDNQVLTVLQIVTF